MLSRQGEGIRAASRLQSFHLPGKPLWACERVSRRILAHPGLLCSRGGGSAQGSGASGCGLWAGVRPTHLRYVGRCWTRTSTGVRVLMSPNMRDTRRLPGRPPAFDKQLERRGYCVAGVAGHCPLADGRSPVRFPACWTEACPHRVRV